MFCNSEKVTPGVYYPIKNGDVLVLYGSEASCLDENDDGISITFQSLLDAELSDFAKKYIAFGEPLGFGASSVVQKCRDRRTGEVFAVKIVNMKKATGAKARSRLRNESTILSSLNHKNVAKIYNCFEDQRHIYLVLELFVV